MPPLLYLGGVAFVLIGGSRATFLLGHGYSHGVWFYFPVVFILKSPLGFLALLVLAVLLALGSKRRVQLAKPAVPLEFPPHCLAFWVSLFVFPFFSLLTRPPT